jgi:glutamyl-Q tRNA(Asp) synthetase
MPRTRFAPSPTGYLHLGHAYALYYADKIAKQDHSQLLLRIEDIDTTRSKEEFIDAIIEDSIWLGFSYDGDIIKQSEHTSLYHEYLMRLHDMGLLYPCFCSRKDIEQAQNAHNLGEDRQIYPQICRFLSPEEIKDKMQEQPFAWRLKMDEAIRIAEQKQKDYYYFHDILCGESYLSPQDFGDIVLARKDIGTSYHIAVTIDDARQEIEMITRGKDLYHDTAIHRLLQTLWDLPCPIYCHHQLICDDAGKRLSKRHQSLSLRAMRHMGMTADEIIKTLQNTSLKTA